MPIIKDEDGRPIFVSEDSEEFKLHEFHQQRNIQIEINSHNHKLKIMKTNLDEINNVTFRRKT